MLIENIASEDRLIKYQASNIIKNLDDYGIMVYRLIDEYLKSYADFYSLTVGDIISLRDRFYETQSISSEFFISNGHYIGKRLNAPSVSRVCYDLNLILSVLTQKHRFDLMLWLLKSEMGLRVLSVGCGAALELFLLERIRPNVKIDAYDHFISDFARSMLTCDLYEESFESWKGQYDNILLIEVLEHIDNPMSLLDVTSRSLRPGGFIYLTTAINHPQHDHLYNFRAGEILEMLEVQNLECVSLSRIRHAVMVRSLETQTELVCARLPK